MSGSILWVELGTYFLAGLVCFTLVIVVVRVLAALERRLRRTVRKLRRGFLVILVRVLAGLARCLRRTVRRLRRGRIEPVFIRPYRPHGSSAPNPNRFKE